MSSITSLESFHKMLYEAIKPACGSASSKFSELDILTQDYVYAIQNES